MEPPQVRILDSQCVVPEGFDCGFAVEVTLGAERWVLPAPVVRAPGGSLESSNLMAGVLSVLPEAPRVLVDLLALGLGPEHASLTVRRAAKRLGIPARTLAHRLGRAGYAAPGHLLRICRILVAAHTLSTGVVPVEQAAHDAGLGRPGTLRGQLDRLFGLKPTQLRAAGRFGWIGLLSALPRVLRAGRTWGGDAGTWPAT